MGDTPAVVVVGAASRDLVDDDERGWRLGGGVSFSSLALARLGFRVGALVVADAAAASSDELAMLRDAGVEVTLVPGARGPVFVNTETPDGRVQLARQVSDQADPAALPAAWRDARAWMLVPVAAELPPVWADVPPAGALVAVGWQGLLRRLVEGEVVRPLPPTSSGIVRRADLVGVGRDDVGPDRTPDSLVVMLRPGATLLLTDGVHGGLALEAAEPGERPRRRSWQSIPAARSVDPVGAGDAFLAGVFAARLDSSLTSTWAGPDPDLRLGAALGSLVLEGPGLYGIPDRAAVHRRLAAHHEPG